jgi:hypothetical protein
MIRRFLAFRRIPFHHNNIKRAMNLQFPKPKLVANFILSLLFNELFSLLIFSLRNGYDIHSFRQR